MKECSEKFRVAVLLLSALIFLAFASVSYVSAYNDIQATVRVVPTASMKCFPNPLITESREKAITCYIKLENFDVRKIIPSTIRLSVVEQSVAQIPTLANSPNTIGDFDNDGLPDLKVTFDKKIVNDWFSNLYMPEIFTFKITGEITGVPDYTFTALDEIQVINPSITFLDFFGTGGDVNVIKGIDLNEATIAGSKIGRTGKQDITFTKIKEDSTSVKTDLIKKRMQIAGIVDGNIPVKILRRKLITIPFTAWARYDGDECVFTPPSSLVCNGKGDFYKRWIFGLTKENVDIHFETDGTTATLTAKQGDTKVFELANIPLEYFDFTVKPRLRFIVFGY